MTAATAPASATRDRAAPGRPHFALFDALRGLAVMAIVLFHVGGLTNRLGQGALGRVAEALGAQAVIVFFVISGFLLYRPWVAARAAGRPAPSIATYARRRAFRILPAYWVALTVLAIFPGINLAHGWWHYYGFLQLYSGDTVDFGIPVAWTLCVEVTFYVLLPVWALGVRRLRGPWLRAELVPLALAAAIGVVLEVLAARREVSQLLADSLPGQMPWLALGMALAVASVAVGRREGDLRPTRLVVRHPLLCWVGVAAALAGLAAMVPSGGLGGLLRAINTPQPLAQALIRPVLSALVGGLFVLPAVFGEGAGGLPRRLLAFAPVALLGTISYSVYLYHLTLAHLIALPADPSHFRDRGAGLLDHVAHLQTLVLYVVVLAAAVVAGGLSYRFIERPFLRRK